MDVTAPEYYDFWQQLFRSIRFAPSTLARIRRTSRLFRAVVDRHASCEIDLHDDHNRRLYDDIVRRKETNLRITSLTLHPLFNEPLRSLTLPDTLITLNLGKSFDRSIDAADLPRALERLNLGLLFKQPLDTRVLPKSLTYLHLGHYYNHPLNAKDLPRSLVAIHMSSSFDQDLDTNDLPRTLVYVHLGYSFNRRLHVQGLPRSLKTLILSTYFSQPLDTRHLPDTLVRLEIGTYFGRKLDTSGLPRTLRLLSVYQSYRQEMSVRDMPKDLVVEFRRCCVAKNLYDHECKHHRKLLIDREWNKKKINFFRVFFSSMRLPLGSSPSSCDAPRLGGESVTGAIEIFRTCVTRKNYIYCHQPSLSGTHRAWYMRMKECSSIWFCTTIGTSGPRWKTMLPLGVSDALMKTMKCLVLASSL